MTHPWRPGQVLTEQRLNQGYMIGREVARLVRETAQSITSQATPQLSNAIVWQSADLDLLDGWNESSNPTRYTPTVPGRYEFSVVGGFMGDSGGSTRIMMVAINGSIAGTSGSGATSPPSSLNLSIAVPVSHPMSGHGDYVEVVPAQNSGGTLDTSTLIRFRPTLTVTYRGPLS